MKDYSKEKLVITPEDLIDAVNEINKLKSVPDYFIFLNTIKSHEDQN